MNFIYNLLTGKYAAKAYGVLTRLLYNQVMRRLLLGYLAKAIKTQLSTDKNHIFSSRSPRILNERRMMVSAIFQAVQSAIEHKRLKPDVVRAVLKLWADAVIIPRENNLAVQQFQHEYGCRPPRFLVISPGHACNLHCRDCYASSSQDGARLPWNTLQRLIQDARRLWDIRLGGIFRGRTFCLPFPG